MRRWIAATLVIVLLAACGGGESETAEDNTEAVLGTPQGTPEAQAAFESFLDSPFISDSQAESTSDMVWRACAAFDEGATWQEFEDQTKADAEAQGTPLGSLQVAGMRSAAGKGIPAYCPRHSDKAP